MENAKTTGVDDSGNDEYNPYTVGYWRNRFKEIRPRLKRNWHRQLADFEPSLDSLKGANDMRAVAHGKASITVTQRIVELIEVMLSKTKVRKHRNKTLEERLKLW